MELDLFGDLTLRIVRAIQGPPVNPIADWFLVPDMVALTWREMAQHLAALPKPVLVAPSRQAGQIGIWSATLLSNTQRLAIDRQTVNRTEYFAQKLALFPAPPITTIELTLAAGGPMQLARLDFERWVREYSLDIGLTLSSSETPATARLLLVVPGSGRPPLGIE